MGKSRQAVGLLGGSFDPVHNGHVAIAKSFLDTKFISKLWILLTPEPPHKTEKALCNYEYRLKMLRAAFLDINDVEIKDIENKLPRPSYTIQTLEHLTAKYPDTKFYLCVGEDAIGDFTEWKDWKKILDLCELLVARRPSFDVKNLDSTLVDKIHFVDHHLIDISSTEIRERIAEGKDISALVPDKVHKIIRKANLYTN